MTPVIEFLIAETFPDGRITGRNCEADAPVGIVFTALFRRDSPRHASVEEIVSPAPVFVCEVSLRLDAIEMYRRSVDVVDHGHTAMISLTGNGFATVTSCVSSAPQNTSYSLCAFDEASSIDSPT